MIQTDLAAFAFEGLNLAFEFNFEQEIKATLPNNGEARTTVKVVDLVGSLALKGKALDGRFKPKDAYDIFALTHFQNDPKKAAEYFNKTVSGKTLPMQNKTFLEHSISTIRDKFKDANQVGPFQVETFTEGAYNRQVVAAQVKHFLELLVTP